VLRELGAWDPYNVAEDADLGIRLHKAGYRTSVMDATTYEEATARTGNWIRQRSRWIKGYMQTYLVHMRHPLRLWRALGTPGFIGFQALIGGTPLTLLLNPIYALLTTLWYLTHLGVLDRRQQSADRDVRLHLCQHGRRGAPQHLGPHAVGGPLAGLLEPDVHRGLEGVDPVDHAAFVLGKD